MKPSCEILDDLRSMMPQNGLDRNTKHVLKMVRHEHTEKLQSQLPPQGFIITFLLNHSLTELNSPWSSAQSSLPKNILTSQCGTLTTPWLVNRTNLQKWRLSSSSDCYFCMKPESPLHIVVCCKSCLEDGRHTWRHNSAVQFI